MLPEAWQEPGLSHPHNIILDYWTRLGIGGVVILVWLQLGFFKLAVRLYRGLPEGNGRAIILGLIAGMAATLAHGLIDNAYFLVDLAFIFFLGVGMVRAMSLRSMGPPRAEPG
jgi:O-antigen ligase